MLKGRNVIFDRCPKPYNMSIESRDSSSECQCLNCSQLVTVVERLPIDTTNWPPALGSVTYINKVQDHNIVIKIDF